MAHGLELVAEVAAHALRRRIGVEELRVQRLQILQFAHQRIELLVGDDRSVEDVVIVVVLVELLS